MNKKCVRNFGDAFTKIGGGIFGGTTVGFYFNYCILDKPVKLFPVYYLLLLFGVFLLFWGYYLMNWAEKQTTNLGIV